MQTQRAAKAVSANRQPGLVPNVRKLTVPICLGNASVRDLRPSPIFTCFVRASTSVNISMGALMNALRCRFGFQQLLPDGQVSCLFGRVFLRSAVELFDYWVHFLRQLPRRFPITRRRTCWPLSAKLCECRGKSPALRSSTHWRAGQRQPRHHCRCICSRIRRCQGSAPAGLEMATTRVYSGVR